MNVLDGVSGFTFGCDPEAFIVNAKGEPVSPDMIPGTKEEPYKVPHGAVQRDGMAAEFNIDPAKTFAEFNRNIEKVMGSLRAFLPEGHDLAIVPSVTFSKEAFDLAPDKDKELGCSPDFNAWTGDINPPPHDPDNPYMRCAAGHLHIGWTAPGEEYSMGDTQHIMNCQDLVRQFDWFLGAYSVSLDTDPTRRRLYGKGGAYRPKPYGVEYRVLSNFWIGSRERRLAVWNRMQIAIAEMKKRYIPDRVPRASNESIVAYINNTKRDTALERTFRYPIMTTEAMYANF